jgi:hypothetical protein
MLLSQQVESYRYWDIVTQWASESGQAEHVVARALARAVLREGLRLQSVPPEWTRPGTFELKGSPLVGYVAQDGALPVFIRDSALKHLRNIVEAAARPNPEALAEEFITKQDFAAWLVQSHVDPPRFWFHEAPGDAGPTLPAPE